MWKADLPASPQSAILDCVTWISLLSKNFWTGTLKLKQLIEEIKRTKATFWSIFGVSSRTFGPTDWLVVCWINWWIEVNRLRAFYTIQVIFPFMNCWHQFDRLFIVLLPLSDPSSLLVHKLQCHWNLIQHFTDSHNRFRNWTLNGFYQIETIVPWNIAEIQWGGTVDKFWWWLVTFRALNKINQLISHPITTRILWQDCRECIRLIS